MCARTFNEYILPDELLKWTYTNGDIRIAMFKTFPIPPQFNHPRLPPPFFFSHRGVHSPWTKVPESNKGG